MTPEFALQLFGDAFQLTMLMVAVIVGPSLAVGLIVATFQAATQINEQTLSFLPRLMVTIATIMVTGPWLLANMMDLFESIILVIPEILS
ncbi:MAG: flagellar biosynthetic protein FliQ [Agarilytica sp.]